MAELTLTLEDYRGAEALPRLCARCGRPARGRRWVRLPGGSSGVGLFLGVAAGQALDTLERMLTSKGGIYLPVCWWHRWIVPPNILVKSVSAGRVTLDGISPEFVTAFRGPAHGGERH